MILDELRAAREPDRYPLLVRYIEDELLDILDWRENQRAQLSRGFVAIGFDSLMSVDLQFRMQRTLGFVADSADDFRQPSVAALASHLLASGLLPLDGTARHDAASRGVGT
jgi:hypothetical protein